MEEIEVRGENSLGWENDSFDFFSCVLFLFSMIRLYIVVEEVVVYNF